MVIMGLKYFLKRIKNRKPKSAEVGFCVLIIFAVVFAGLGSLLQSNFGTIDIEYLSLTDEFGNTVTGKLYKPKSATIDTPAPGVLAAHGMNNDKDTEAPIALELAKRGIVVVSVDQHNHGWTPGTEFGRRASR